MKCDGLIKNPKTKILLLTREQIGVIKEWCGVCVFHQYIITINDISSFAYQEQCNFLNGI